MRDLFGLTQLLLAVLIFVPFERLFAARPQKIFRRGLLTDMAFLFINGGLVLAGVIAIMTAVILVNQSILPAAVTQAIGGLPRQMAHDYGYPELAKKNESYEICFVPDNDYRGFLKRKVEGLEEKVAVGNFVDKHVNILGQDKGYPFYTIGHPKAPHIVFGKPVFVRKIDPDNNTVMLGDEEDLEQNEMLVGKLNLIKYDFISPGMETSTKIRYKDKGALSNLYPGPSATLRIRFYENVKGIAPGQSAVFYEGDDVLGGGIIQRGELV